MYICVNYLLTKNKIHKNAVRINANNTQDYQLIVRIRAGDSFVLSQYTRMTDTQTDRWAEFSYNETVLSNISRFLFIMRPVDMCLWWMNGDI